MTKTKTNARTISKRPSGKWANKKDGATKATSLHNTQKEAESEARQMLKESGGGELKTKNVKGKIRSKDTIAPGNDPISIRDTEN